MVSILVVGLYEEMVSQIEATLTGEGMNVTTAKAQDGLPRLDEEHADLVVLNVDGNPSKVLNLCQEIREQTTVPLLLLAQNDQEAALAEGLEIGADAYLVKPVTMRVFLAQTYALLRRIGLVRTGFAEQLEADGLVINDHRKEATLYGRPVKLTPTEYEILKLLMQNPGRALSHRSIVRQVQGYDCDEWEAREILKVHVHNLRRKIEPRLGEPRFIRTVREFGYMFDRRRSDREELEGILISDG